MFERVNPVYVQAFDGGGLSSVATVKVTVRDVNNKLPIIVSPEEGAVIKVSEDARSGHNYLFLLSFFLVIKSLIYHE